MANSLLLKALNQSKKEFFADVKESYDLALLKKYRNMLVYDPGVFSNAIKTGSIKSGQALLNELGFTDLFIVHIKETELFTSCYQFIDSVCWKHFMNLSKNSKTLTVIFSSGKRNLVVSNQYDFQGYAKVRHIVYSTGNLNNICWVPLEDLVDTDFKFYQ